MHYGKECNGKSRVEYEMFKKQWLINGIFSENKKMFESEFFSKIDV